MICPALIKNLVVQLARLARTIHFSNLDLDFHPMVYYQRQLQQLLENYQAENWSHLPPYSYFEPCNDKSQIETKLVEDAKDHITTYRKILTLIPAISEN